VIGKISGAESLGFYRKALLIYDNTLDLTLGLHSVASTSLSKLRANLDELRRLWAKALTMLSFYAMPVFGLIAATCQDIIVLVLKEKWAGAGLLLSVIAYRGMPHVVERTLGWLHVAAGRADRWMRWGLLAACVQCVALAAGAPFGPRGIAVAYTIAMYVMFIPTIAYAGKPLGIGAKDVVRAVRVPLFGTLTATVAAAAVRFGFLMDLDRLPRLAITAVVFLAAYLLIVVYMFKLREPLTTMLSFLPRNRPSVQEPVDQVPGR
jgi:PST family polysaccharide transporter